MEISIDESGSFALKGASENSWCVVVAYASPETEKRKYQAALSTLKHRSRKSITEEVKLREVKESDYILFLRALAKLKGTLFCVATDSGLNLAERVNTHQQKQAEHIASYIEKMLYQGGKKAMSLLSGQLLKLSPQLYVQLMTQVYLMHTFMERGICYYVQRNPNVLQGFKWRVDQKSPDTKTDFEDAFEKLAPAILQTFTIQKPAPFLDWCDYRPLSKYMITMPEYLMEHAPELKGREGLDLTKIIRDDIQFIDSKSHTGIQVADLLASGLRQLLRMEFENNEEVADALGGLFIQGEKNHPPITFLTFGPNEEYLDNERAPIVRKLQSSSRRMIVRR